MYLLYLLLFIITPLLVTSVFVNVDTWLWRGVLLGSVGFASLWSFALAIALGAGIIIGTAFASSLRGITGSPV